MLRRKCLRKGHPMEACRYTEPSLEPGGLASAAFHGTQELYQSLLVQRH